MKSREYCEITEKEKIETEKEIKIIEQKIDDFIQEATNPNVDYQGYRKFHNKILRNNIISEKLEADRQSNIKNIVDEIKKDCRVELVALAEKMCISNVENFITYIASQMINIVKSDVDFIINHDKDEDYAIKKYAWVQMKEENKNRTL